MLKTKLDRVVLLAFFVLSVAFYGTSLFKLILFQYILGEWGVDWNDAEHNWMATYARVVDWISIGIHYSSYTRLVILPILLIFHAVCALVPFIIVRTALIWIKKGQ